MSDELRQAAQAALEALHENTADARFMAIQTLEAALAEQPEPVAWQGPFFQLMPDEIFQAWRRRYPNGGHENFVPLYKEKGADASYASTPCLAGQPTGEQRERTHDASLVTESVAPRKPVRLTMEDVDDIAGQTIPVAAYRGLVEFGQMSGPESAKCMRRFAHAVEAAVLRKMGVSDE